MARNSAPRLESGLENLLDERVRATGGETRKVQWPGRRGAPDRFCFWPGRDRSAFVELKRDGGEPDPHQAREIERLRSAGLRVYAVASLEDLGRFMKDMLS